jgi:hypothetical protein
MADAVTFTGKLAATLGSTTVGNTTSSASLDIGTANDCVCGTIDSTTTPAELDLSTVAKTGEHAICIRNDSTATAPSGKVTFAIRSVSVASGSIVSGSYYLVTGNTVTYDAVTYAIGDLVTGTATTTHTGSGVLYLLVPLAIAYPGDIVGPLRREAFTAAGYGAIYHWISSDTAKLERCAAETGTPA